MTKILFVLLITCLSTCLHPTLISAADHGSISVYYKGFRVDAVRGKLYVRARNSYSVDALSAKLSGAFADKFFVEGHLHPPAARKDRSLQQSLNPVSGTTDRIQRTYVVGFDPGISPLDAVRLLEKCDEVEIAEPWVLARMNSVPNDPIVSQQSALSIIHAFEGWDIYNGDTSMVIGIVDNGVDQTHEDLLPSIAPNYKEIPDNMIDDDNNGYVDDYLGYNLVYKDDGTQPGNTHNSGAGGHGTYVAGLAAAKSNNMIGIAGVGGMCRFFPIKSGKINDDKIQYGYQAMLYAAERRFRVINCSWGSPKAASAVEQDIVDYCIERNVLIVASAGNHGARFDGAAWKLSNYPASYDGVLGVAETYDGLGYTDISGLGRNADVSAPSFGQISTRTGGGYVKTDGGTSFSSPMAAGAAALIRAKYRSLTPMQTLAYMRSLAVDITDQNPGLPIPASPRIDLLEYMKGNPLATVGIRFTKLNIYSKRGSPVERLVIGDTVLLEFELKNELAACADIHVEVSQTQGSSWNVTFIDHEDHLASLSTNEIARTRKFRAIVNSVDEYPCIVAVKLTSGAYLNAELVYIDKPSNVSDFENDELLFSMTDDGGVAYNANETTKIGAGFGWKSGYQLMSPSGFIAKSGNTAVRGFDNQNYHPDFKTVKPFIAPDRNLGVMNDSNGLVAPSDAFIGIEVSQRVAFSSQTSRSAIIDISVRNTSGKELETFACGYMLDIDVGPVGDKNTAVVVPDMVPASSQKYGSGVIFKRAGYDVVLGLAILGSSAELAGSTQAIGQRYSDLVLGSSPFTRGIIVNALAGGLQNTTATEDLCALLGVRYAQNFQPDQRKEFRVIIGVGADSAEAVGNVRSAVNYITSVTDVMTFGNRVYPNPASTMIHVEDVHPGDVLELYDIFGSRMWAGHPTESTMSIPVDSVAPGSYVLKVSRDRSAAYHNVVIIR